MNIIVTDHAILRYFERIHGFDIEMIRKHIEAAVSVPAKVGATTVTIDGYVYCLVERDDGDVAVTTILDSTMRAKRYNRHKRRGHYKETDCD